MKTGVILSCYDKVDDLLVQTEILRFANYGPKTIVVYMHEDDPPAMPKNVDFVRIQSPGFRSGPLLSLTAGLRRAADLGLDYVIYRNADDWFFNHNLTSQWLNYMAQTNKIAAGYSWLEVDSFSDIAMNENILSVASFMTDIDEAEKVFAIQDGANCETKMAWWVRKTLMDKDKFFRLPGREQQPGIGWHINDAPDICKQRKIMVPDMWRTFPTNNRFFNQEWQMIGSHDNASRNYYWQVIRNVVPYRSQLEEGPHFRRWLLATRYFMPWNKQEVNWSRIGIDKDDLTLKRFPRRLIKVSGAAGR